MSEQETRDYLTRIEMMNEYLSEADDMINEELEAEIMWAFTHR